MEGGTRALIHLGLQLENISGEWKIRHMSDTLLREKNQITLPGDVVNAAGLSPSDRIDWRFENGEIRGRKVTSQPSRRIIGKLLRRGDSWVLDCAGMTITESDIAQAVREERDR